MFDQLMSLPPPWENPVSAPANNSEFRREGCFPPVQQSTETGIVTKIAQTKKGTQETVYRRYFKYYIMSIYNMIIGYATE